LRVQVASSLSGVVPAEWNRLTGGNPFLRHEFLSALHDTGCAAPESGWTPTYLLLQEDNRLQGALPLYLKSHSYGEYVFDWAWADAYERHGLAYYPKLLSAVPFTPVTGPRLLAASHAIRHELMNTAITLATELGVSSLHCLFPTQEQAHEFAAQGLMLRHGVQFHWMNPGYADFDAFLRELNHEKRKKIRQERRRVRDAGIHFRWLDGPAMDDSHWAFFSRCYDNTYRAHHSTPYLNLAFFRRIGTVMPENLLLVLAEREGQPIAASLNVHNGSTLYGRYWGGLEYHPGLHFEACYYQVIEYCIARGITCFEGGAQGEHKMARGLMPVRTCSAHWLAHPQFADAVEHFLARETAGVAHYMDELNERAPFRSAV